MKVAFRKSFEKDLRKLGDSKEKMMSVTYHLKASEIDQKFIEDIKTKYGNKEISITIEEMNETDYLFQSEANKKRLLNAVESVKQGSNLVEVSWEDLE